MTPARFARLSAVLRRRQPDLTVLTDAVHKSHNVSAILRTCDAVGVPRLHAVARSGRMRRHHMITGGAKRFVEIEVHANIEAAYAALRTAGFRRVVAHSSPESVDFRELDYTARIAVVLGAELRGPSRFACDGADAHVSIPMQGVVESLNVSVAAALILYEAERQREAAGLYATSRMDEREFAKTLFEYTHPEIAERCRERGLEYPPLGPEGELLANPFAEA